MSDIDPKKLKVTELREELKSRGLDTKGNKAQLVKRLEKALASSEESGDADTSAAGDGDTTATSQELDTSATQESASEDVEAADEAAQQAKPEAEEPEAVQQMATDSKQEDSVEAVAEEAPEAEGQEEQAAEGQAVQEGQQVTAMESGEPEAEQEQDDQQGEFQVMDSIGGDSEAPEADQKMEEEKSEEKSEEKEKEDKKDEGDRERKRRHSGDRYDRDHEHERDRYGRSRRSRSRSRSPRHRSRSRSRERYHRSYSPPKIEMEDDSEFLATTHLVLDLYNCDLNLRIEDGNKGDPITVEGFAFMWAGARANYGAAKGKVAFEVKLGEELQVDHLPPEEKSRHVVRVGWSTDSTSTQLGEEENSFGYGGTAKASTDCKFKDYGETFKSDDVVTAYLDWDSETPTMSYSKNGEDQGVCFELDKEKLGEQALFPHILTKNTKFEVNFGKQETPWFPLKEGYVFINDVPLEDRVRGSLPPKKKKVPTATLR